MKAIKKVTIKPGELIVFEGMDATGKTTQMDRIRNIAPTVFQEPYPFFTHQPSGGTPVGEYVYQITEFVETMSPLTRQFLHLAAHADQWQYSLVHELSTRAVFMDRWWWSTMAYAQAGGLFDKIDQRKFQEVVLWPLLAAGFKAPAEPSALFLFSTTYQEDKHNTQELYNAYSDLYDTWINITPIIEVPRGAPDEVTTFIFDTLEEYKIADIEWEEVEV